MDENFPKLQHINPQIPKALVNLKQDPYKENHTSVCPHSAAENKKQKIKRTSAWEKVHPLHTGGNAKNKS